MSENLCEGGAPTFLPNRALSGFKPALLFRQFPGPAFSSPAILYVNFSSCKLSAPKLISSFRNDLARCVGIIFNRITTHIPQQCYYAIRFRRVQSSTATSRRAFQTSWSWTSRCTTDRCSWFSSALTAFRRSLQSSLHRTIGAHTGPASPDP